MYPYCLQGNYLRMLKRMTCLDEHRRRVPALTGRGDMRCYRTAAAVLLQVADELLLLHLHLGLAFWRRTLGLALMGSQRRLTDVPKPSQASAIATLSECSGTVLGTVLREILRR